MINYYLFSEASRLRYKIQKKSDSNNEVRKVKGALNTVANVGVPAVTGAMAAASNKYFGPGMHNILPYAAAAGASINTGLKGFHKLYGGEDNTLDFPGLGKVASKVVDFKNKLVHRSASRELARRRARFDKAKEAARAKGSENTTYKPSKFKMEVSEHYKTANERVRSKIN